MLRGCFPFFLLISILMISCGCTQNPVDIKASMTGNAHPPVLLEVVSLSSQSVRLVFDREVEIFENSFSPYDAYSDGFGIVVNLPASLSPGHKTELCGRVVDNNGNTTGFRTPVWGYNSFMAGMLINELATKDVPKTEILITSAGNTAGAVLYNGIPEDHEGMAMLPDLDVNKGDFIVVIWDSAGKTSGSHEVLSDISLSGKGYSNNGIQTLAVSPAEGAEVLDCVVYSNSSSTFGGYGNSSTLSRVQTAVSKHWWKNSENPVNSSSSTKLRTMCRKSGSEDTDSFEDWYTAKDSGATFGFPNTSEAFIRH